MGGYEPARDVLLSFLQRHLVRAFEQTHAVMEVHRPAGHPATAVSTEADRVA
jgi:hypothetical protein